MDFLKGTITAKDWMAVGIILACAGAILFLMYFFVYRGQQDTLTRIQNEYQQVSTQVQEALFQRDNIDELRTEMEKTERLVSDFEKRLPSRSEIATFTNQFERLAREVGLEVGVKPLARSRDQQKETIPYEITAHGSFHQIVSFVNKLERFERYLKISDLQIKEQTGGISEARFTLSTYRIIEAPVAAPATGGAA
jgi:type IV pilus assembly protein PilO